MATNQEPTEGKTFASLARGDEPETRLDMRKFPAEHFNVLVPTQTVRAISPYHIVSLVQVRVDPDPKHGMVFDVGGGKLALAKPALDNISLAAGVTWDPSRTRPILNESRRCICQAVGGIRRPDGIFIAVTATKEINMDVIEAEIALKNEEKVAAGTMTQAQAEFKAKREAVAFWKHMLARCDTGARLRVVRAMFGLKSSYTAAELQRPFVVPVIQFNPWNDPEMAEKARIALAQQTSELFDDSPTRPTPEVIEAQKAIAAAKAPAAPDWGPAEVAAEAEVVGEDEDE